MGIDLANPPYDEAAAKRETVRRILTTSFATPLPLALCWVVVNER